MSEEIREQRAEEEEEFLLTTTLDQENNLFIREVSGLSGISRLREVNLACSEISSLDGLKDLPSLYLLDLRHTRVKDLRPLKGLSSLKKVIVSMDMIPLTLDADAHYDVIVVK